MLNDGAFVRDDRFVLAVGTTEVSVALRAPVRAVTEHAIRPTAVSDLVALLARRFPTTPEPVVVDLLDRLIERGFLITALQPPMTVTRPLRHVIDTAVRAGAATIPDTAALVAELAGIDTALQSPGGPDELLGSAPLAARMRAVADVARPLGVDVRVDADIALPEPVLREAAVATQALVTLSPAPAGSGAWADYHHRFLDRYGIGALVTLADVLHPDRGLGYPSGYRGASLAAPSRRHPGPRDDLLLGLAHDAAWNRSGEIELTERDLVDLASAERGAGGRVPPPHTELRVEVHAPSRSAMDAGQFRLVVLGAARAAGTLTGRFLDQFDDAERRRMAGAYAALPTVTAGALTVQVSGPPTSPRSANVARSPAVLPTRIGVATHDGVDDRIALSDLAVGADTAGLYLVWLPRRMVVEPIMFSAIELVAAAHPTVRFLTEIATARTAACSGFSWGAARTLRFLPRLRHGRSVLAPARWTVPAADLTGPLSGPAGRRAWEAWRERWQVPDRVLLGQDDRRLPLDLTVPAHRHVVLDTLSRRERLILTEAPAPDAFAWIGGRAHELVLPMVRTTSPRHPTRPRPTASSTPQVEDVHLPGSGTWLYARLHTHPDRQTAVFTEHLPELLDALTAVLGGPPEWWFIRHTDPDHHIRLRVRLPRTSAFALVAACLGAWADGVQRDGLLRSLQYDTYRPETGRFGSGPAMTAAETVFCADSAAAMAQLRLARLPEVQAVIAASMLGLVTAFSRTVDDGLRWLLQNTPRSVPTRPARELRARATALAGPLGHDQLAGSAVGDLVLAAWARRSAALVDYRAALIDIGTADPDIVLPDLLHLHHARVAGLVPDGERVCLHLARSAALSLTARTRRAA